MLHPLDERPARNAEPSVAVRETAGGESDRQTRDRNHHEEPSLSTILQGRCSPRESWVSAVRENPCPAVRSSRKSNLYSPGRRRRTGTAWPPRSRGAALLPPPLTTLPQPHASDATGRDAPAVTPPRATASRPRDGPRRF